MVSTASALAPGFLQRREIGEAVARFRRAVDVRPQAIHGKQYESSHPFPSLLRFETLNIVIMFWDIRLPPVGDRPGSRHTSASFLEGKQLGGP